MESSSPNLRSILGGAARVAPVRPSDARESSLRVTRDSSSASDEVEEDEYVAFGNGRVGNRPQLTIVFRKASGEVFAFPYLSLSMIRSLDPDRGFKAEFSGVEVTVIGENLGKLFRHVCDHKAVELVEADRSQQFNATNECPIITEIVLKE